MDIETHTPRDALTLRNAPGGTLLVDAIVRAHTAAMAAVLTGFRMVAFTKPFGGGPRYWHLIVNGRRLSLCATLAAGRTTTVRHVDLSEITCMACLDTFAEMVRP